MKLVVLGLVLFFSFAAILEAFLFGCGRVESLSMVLLGLSVLYLGNSEEKL